MDDDNDSSTCTWQIDHIVPQSNLPYTSVVDKNFKLCWSSLNLRPCSAKQNILDGSNKVRNKKMIDYSDIQNIIEECFNEISASSRSKYDVDKADRTAALFLMAQMKLSFLIENVEFNAKQSKNEITRIEGEKYFDYKTSGGDKKITENMLTSFVSKEPDIVAAKLECAKQEAALKKWNYLLNTLKDSHIYFRNLSKNKTWNE